MGVSYIPNNGNFEFVKKNLKKINDTNAKHPQMFTYKMTAVSAEEARDGGRTIK